MRSYLDHASVSPMRPEVIEAMGELLSVAQADPGRPYEEAIVIRGLIEDARSSVASLARAAPRQVVFESSLAESAAHAVSSLGAGRVILASATSRQSVMATAERVGELEELGVDQLGHLRLDQLDERLAVGDVGLVSFQVANHETGVIDDAAEIIERCHRAGASVHLDAAVALGRLELALGALGAEATTVTGELLGGPLGAAATIVRAGTVLSPMILGGSQERARRAGLENLMGIVGFGVAAAVLGDARVRVNERERASIQRTRLEQAAEDVDGVSVVGDRDARLPQITCVVVDGIEAEAIVMGLDRSGISVHSGSACSSEALEPSPVLAAMGLDADRSVRVSVGWSTTEGDVERFSERFGSVVSSLRALRD